MNRKESIEIAERELPAKMKIRYKGKLSIAQAMENAYAHGFNKGKDECKPLLADKIMEIDAWKKGADIKSDGGSDRECGHFVKDILSFCPVCRKIAELQQKLDDVEAERDVIKFINKKTEQKLDRVLGLDYARNICETEVIPKWAEEFGLETSAEMDVALSKVIETAIKQKIQEVVGG